MEDLPINVWLRQLASRTPTPGGGAAAALFLATAAGLLAMVAAYTTGKRWADRENEMEQLRVDLLEHGQTALDIATRDEAAFSAVSRAYALSNGEEHEKVLRRAAVQKAIAGAAEPPKEVLVLARELVGMAERLRECGNRNVLSDVGVAATGIRAAVESAALNIQINLVSLDDEAEKKQLSVVILETDGLLEQLDQVLRGVKGEIAL